MQLTGFKRLLRGCTESTSWDACLEAGMAAYERRDYADAEERLLAALKLAAAFGLEDRRVVTTRNSLAETYRALRRYADAKDQVEKKLPCGRLERRLDGMRFHLIEAEELMSELSMDSKFNTHLSFLTMLRDQGRACADRWLARNFNGTELRLSVNLAELFC